MVEFVEVCGNEKHHREARWPLYHNAHGLILVHDLTDEASLSSLSRWYASYSEFAAQQGAGVRQQRGPDAAAVSGGPVRRRMQPAELDSQDAPAAVPTLVVGTKRDAVSGRRSLECLPRGAGWIPGWRRFVLRVTASVLRWQRLLARLFSRLLFLPVPQSLREGPKREEAEVALKQETGATFCEWSSTDPSHEQIEEVYRFVDSVLEATGTGV
eukprot:TRINITY_DN7820_c1_g3_i2.p1 TRINITY_DN7820_c1_g3~~TRINITY_DN7820_c1_g3_i2.p1  ORF type:complete len:213 (+),score=50.35 TRINITY_DN7820_c1_g3_i2:340-978(+)